MTFVSSVKFESAARAQETTENFPGDDDDAQKSQNQSPPLASGRFVDCHAVRLRQQKNQSKSSDDNSEVAAVADAVEEAWRLVRHVYSEGKDSAVSIVPMLLSPLHRLRMFFSPHEQEQGAAVSPIIGDGVQALAKRLVACQVAEAAEQALKSEEGTSEDAAPAVTAAATADDEWPYNPKMPTLLLVDSLCAAREERAGGDLRLVCNPQTPVRDWFRVLNHDLSNKNAPTRLLPLLTVEGTACGTQPVYCAVRVPQAEDYHDKHKELRQWGVDHSKDPGLQWQVLCDYTKIAIKDMQARSVDFQIHPLVMSHDRSLRGVLVQNYTDADLRALRNKFGIRWLDEAA